VIQANNFFEIYICEVCIFTSLAFVNKYKLYSYVIKDFYELNKYISVAVKGRKILNKMNFHAFSI